MNPHHHLRLTPSNSPFHKTASPRSPTKSRSEEAGLRLKKVIGSTTASANGFDCLPTSRQFAYTAGAAAVVSTVDEDLRLTQRFFRARPAFNANNTVLRDANGQGPISPTPTDARSRVLREGSAPPSPLAADSPPGKSATAKDRVKAATSVALSPNGKWVAVGETGYKPRILIFSNKGDSSEAPVCALAEHTFGVHSLAFSPDSRYLASLGTVNDGFLFVWSIDDRTGYATLHSSNKCSVMINAMTWVGRSILTIGLRFVKFWRPDDDASGERHNSEPHIATPKHRATEYGNSVLSVRHKSLLGRNALLGDLIDANFVVAVPLSSDRAIVCADSGEICLVDDCQKAQSLTVTGLVDFRISAATLDNNDGLVVSGVSGKSKWLALRDLESPITARSARRQTISPSKAVFSDTTTTIAMATIGGVSLEMDSKRGIRLTRSKGADAEVASHQLAAHDDAVLGVQQFASDALPTAAFLSFSSNGSIQIWSTAGDSVASLQVPVDSAPEMFDLVNELKAVAALQKGSLLAAGDKYGTLSLLNVSAGSVVTQVRAHSAEIMDTAAFERSGIQFIATCGRDRTVQLFACTGEQLELLQTMDEHAAAVNGLLVAEDGDMLLSCSSDRTVVIREAMSRPDDPSSVAFIMLRTITLKSSPTSMCWGAGRAEILVSTVDRSIGTYTVKNGQAGFSFKCSDSEGGETAALSKIAYASSLNGNPTIVGVSSGDKSVRLYSEYGALLARDWGHTEGITDVALLPCKTAEGGEQHPRTQLVTVAADSTIFMWDTVSHAPEATGGASDTPTPQLPTPMQAPLRKVLSSTELSRFKRDSNDPDRQISPSPSPSPTRLKEKPSRVSVAQPPRLEPAFRSSRHRSPSPPESPRTASPRKAASRKHLHRPSSENLAHASGGFGSLAASTESVSRTLRAYRKKLAVAPADGGGLASEALRELGRELEVTGRVVGEIARGRGDVGEVGESCEVPSPSPSSAQGNVEGR